jgi:hypothetical protein
MMVGWSRRGSESSARRKLWWDSLTQEEKADAVAKEAASDEKVVNVVLVVLSIAILALLVYSMVIK